MKLDFEEGFERILRCIEERKARRVLIQGPFVLLRKVLEKVKEIKKKTGCEVFITTRETYGACDLALEELKTIKGDLLIHLGHEKMLDVANVCYVPFYYSFEKEEVEFTINAIKAAKVERFSIVCSAQYRRLLDVLKKEFPESIRKGNRFLAFEGQVLGCNYSSAKEDFVFVISDGYFHALGPALKGKNVYLINPAEKKVEKINPERFVRQSIVNRELFKGAKNVAIIISKKIGQRRLADLEVVKKTLETLKKSYVVIVDDEIVPEKYGFFNFDGFVVLGCPRIVVEERARFKKPAIGLNELLGRSYIDEMGENYG